MVWPDIPFIKYFNDKTVVLNNQIITGLLLLMTHGCQHCQTRGFTVQQNQQANLFWFQTVCSCKTQVTVEKHLSSSLRYDLVQFRGKLMLFSIIEKKVSSTNLWGRLQFVNSVQRLVFDLTKIPFLKRLIGISRLTVEFLDEQNLFTESNLANWFSSYVQFYSCGHFSERAEGAR